MIGTAASAEAAKTGTAVKADADMQAVLDQLGAMGGKPIESLKPEEARRQPTPADAVMTVLKKQDKDTTPTAVPGVSSADRQIPGAAGNLPARVYTPDGAGPFPVIQMSTVNAHKVIWLRAVGGIGNVNRRS